MIRFVVEVSLCITLSSILVTSRASPLQQGRVTPEKSFEGFLDEPASDDSVYLNNRLRDYGWGQQGVLMTDLKRDQQHGEKRDEEEDKRSHRIAHSFQGMLGKRFFDQQRPLQEEKPKCAMEVVLSFLLGADKTINDPEVKHVLTRCKQNASNRLFDN
ncbi:uncharacterized protein LOC117108071 [Anneissia japonica]|uniref:uncharacterized protein LOC117108071 n=1 Tax=Anneissia japonica TaxID=1529436 RepID=UPI001425531D|nr:uncharacterized protein LOC117108071 [Anneissia japonica]XP_033105832.1 uncharacterized protein LOC117108071 [Anneissia japonica]